MGEGCEGEVVDVVGVEEWRGDCGGGWWGEEGEEVRGRVDFVGVAGGEEGEEFGPEELAGEEEGFGACESAGGRGEGDGGGNWRGEVGCGWNGSVGGDRADRAGPGLEQFIEDIEPDLGGEGLQVDALGTPGNELERGGEGCFGLIDDDGSWAELSWPEDNVFFLIIGLGGWERSGCWVGLQRARGLIAGFFSVFVEVIDRDVKDEVGDGLWQATRSLQLVD